MISILSIYEDMLNAEVIGVNPAVILLLVIIILNIDRYHIFIDNEI